MYDEIFAVSTTVEEGQWPDFRGMCSCYSSLTFAFHFRKKTQQKTTLASGMSSFL